MYRSSELLNKVNGDLKMVRDRSDELYETNQKLILTIMLLAPSMFILFLFWFDPLLIVPADLFSAYLLLGMGFTLLMVIVGIKLNS